MGSCQSWLHRHKAGGGPGIDLRLKALARAEIRGTAHRFPPGSPRWEQQLAATRFAALNASLSLGAKPQEESRWGRDGVAASRGSTGTRPAEAQGRL